MRHRNISTNVEQIRLITFENFLNFQNSRQNRNLQSLMSLEFVKVNFARLQIIRTMCSWNLAPLLGKLIISTTNCISMWKGSSLCFWGWNTIERWMASEESMMTVQSYKVGRKRRIVVEIWDVFVQICINC